MEWSQRGGQSALRVRRKLPQATMTYVQYIVLRCNFDQADMMLGDLSIRELIHVLGKQHFVLHAV